MCARWELATLLACLLCRWSAGQHTSEGTSGSSPLSVAAPGPAEMQDIQNMVRRTVRQIVSQLDPSAEVASSGSRTRKVKDFTRQFHVGTSCHDIQLTQGADRSGVYLVHPANLAQGPWKVYCDLETEGGGWTVFQVRDDVEPHENFFRNWEDYKVGFGDFDREFWLGNILIWALTNVDNSTQFELAIDLEDWSGNKRFARYRGFRLGPERDAYRLYHQNLYYGNAGDSLFSHNGLPFSTFDVDNDSRRGNYSERSCARLYKGAWWYGNCHDSNLNGWYLGGAHRSFADGVNWYTWTGYQYSLRRTQMRLRPQSDAPIPIGQDTFILTNRAGRGGDSGERVDVPELMGPANTLTRP
ncbi:microfibril-associated glycoprotein 4-like isoform X1 [Amphibalanus amphitrite]|uniref:microfibril-associated glycoprotein 4-like isoform X1 n=1 Tax=Amphibalanus amphitrite TaxID=1232801 RepID=UPI001C91F02D|nr:microfibril-associated glycoprotein 4-like isoform X1 [Amphibalanus amphitrite]